MISFAARRLGWALVTAFLVSIAAFVLFWTIPNVDPEYWLGGGEKGNDFTRARAVEKYGLDDPLPVQYERLMKEILNGEVECFYGCSATESAATEPENLRAAFIEALPVTLSLVAGAALIAIGVGTSLALVCVRNKGRWPDRVITAAATAAYSVPSLVLAALLWSFLAYKWQIFPERDYVPLTENPFQWFWHLLLPWIAAALPFAGVYVHVVRGSLLEGVDEDWVRTARAKGLSERRVLRRHVLRNALIPPVNIWGLDFSHAFGGYALYVEVIFELPGIGLLTSATLFGLDLPPIVALAIYLSIVVVFTSAIVDIAVAYLDPRIRRRSIQT
jgi:peptide/nickel transport system permease protein